MKILCLHSAGNPLFTLTNQIEQQNVENELRQSFAIKKKKKKSFLHVSRTIINIKLLNLT